MALPPRIPRPSLVHNRKPDDRSAPKHLEEVRQCDCLLCGAPGPNDPHHMLHFDPTKGMGRKGADRYTIPACRRCHDWLHEQGDDEEALIELGYDARAITSALWREGGVPAKQRVIFRARQMARAA